MVCVTDSPSWPSIPLKDAYVHVKFDNQPIVQYGAAEAADGRSDMIFIENYAGFVQRLRRAKKVTIEAEFYQSGWQQLEFSPTGLNW
jgi:hypothetical protein